MTDPSDPSLFWTFQEATTNETMPREKADSYGTHWVAWRVAAPPQPKDATSAIVETFDKYPVVALAETAHAVDQFHAFYRSLIRDPAFLAKVNDVVIEFGNSLYQPILDHYILKGENVPFAELSKVWRSCPHNFAWEGPVYQEFLKTVHEMNQKLPANRRLRLLAGDAPIDWPKIHTHEEWAKLNDDRDPSCARVVDREVLQKGHRALVIMGSNHLTKSGNRDGEDDTTTLIEAKHPGSVCVVMVSSQDHPKMATWKLPALLTPPPLKTDADAVLYIVPRNSQTLSYMHLKWSDYDDTYLKEVDRRQRIIYGCSFDIEPRKKQADPYQGWPCH